MAIVRLISKILFGLSAVIVVLWTAIEIPTYNMGFYKSHFEKNGTGEVIGISDSDLEKVVDVIIDYLRGNTDELNVTVTVRGESRLFYNQKELDHMVDVQNLFKKFTLLRNISLVYCGLFLAFYMVRKLPLQSVAKILRNSFAAFLGTGVVLFAVIASNFDYWFNVFHGVFFTNDLWRLDYTTDLLINLVPLQFFISIAALIGGICIAVSVCVVFSATVLPRRFKR